MDGAICTVSTQANNPDDADTHHCRFVHTLHYIWSAVSSKCNRNCITLQRNIVRLIKILEQTNNPDDVDGRHSSVVHPCIYALLKCELKMQLYVFIISDCSHIDHRGKQRKCGLHFSHSNFYCNFWMVAAIYKI